MITLPCLSCYPNLRDTIAIMFLQIVHVKVTLVTCSPPFHSTSQCHLFSATHTHIHGHTHAVISIRSDLHLSLHHGSVLLIEGALGGVYDASKGTLQLHSSIHTELGYTVCYFFLLQPASSFSVVLSSVGFKALDWLSLGHYLFFLGSPF